MIPAGLWWTQLGLVVAVILMRFLLWRLERRVDRLIGWNVSPSRPAPKQLTGKPDRGLS